MRSRIVASALWACLLLALAAGGLATLGAAPAGAQSGPPSAEPATDLRSDKLSGPYLEDSSPGRAAGLPMLVGGVAIMGVVVWLFVRSRRGAHERSQ